MATLAVQLKDADRMMVSARALDSGLELAFADGCSGVVPYSDLPEIGTISGLEDLELPNPYEVILRSRRGEVVELPWDFVRNYCEPSYRPRAEAQAAKGRNSLGRRIRSLREAANLTQEALASAAGIGRVTLVRLENGDQSPRYETLLALAKAMNLEPAELLGAE
jgi:DNA-binding XRE family transcriptional regulator